MTQLFARKPIADLLAEGQGSLKRVLGAGDFDHARDRGGDWCRDLLVDWHRGGR